jgi:hypothetical protein
VFSMASSNLSSVSLSYLSLSCSLASNSMRKFLRFEVDEEELPLKTLMSLSVTEVCFSIF